MRRLVWIATLCFFVVAARAFAQGGPGYMKSSLGLNFETSVPVADFADYAGVGFGGNIRFQYGGDPKGVFTATAGYIVWGEKDFGIGSTVQPKAFNFFIGGKYYFIGGFFGTVEGGVYFVSFTREGSVLGVESSATRFMLPVGVGYQVGGIELAARYMFVNTDFTSFSFTLGYNFGL